MKRHWLPLYVADYKADTAHLTTAEHGAYLLLIMHYWTCGGLPDDDRKLSRIVGMDDGEWLAAKDTLAAFFQDGWRHKRIDAEIEKMVAVSEKRRDAANKRHANAMQMQSKCNANAMQKDVHSHSHEIDKSISERNARERASSAASDFERFWSVWPNKVGKPAAAKAFFRVRSECEAIISAVPRYVAETQAAGRPWLNPATFLNQRRWEDSPAPQPMARAGPSQSNRNGFGALAKKLYGNGDGTRTQNGIPDLPLRLLPVDGDGERGTSGADDVGLPRKAFLGFG
jgi:uncharacterized protein YdaU (DUF1376 family)